MTHKQVMAALKKMGTAQNRKIYARHGAEGPLFGVSFANLHALRKQIKVDHPLAVDLWKSGNVDARTLATMIADPAQLDAATAQAWLQEISYGLLANQLGALVSRSPIAVTMLSRWTRSSKEYVRQSGYAVLCHLLKDAPQDVSDDLCRSYLERIERQIHKSPNRAREAMNMAVISIGIAKPHLQRAAIATARRIGPVEVDHGETGCKTPEAEAYILKAAARRSAGKAVTSRGTC